jgi:hypothetical protein
LALGEAAQVRLHGFGYLTAPHSYCTGSGPVAFRR